MEVFLSTEFESKAVGFRSPIGFLLLREKTFEFGFDFNLNEGWSFTAEKTADAEDNANITSRFLIRTNN